MGMSGKQGKSIDGVYLRVDSDRGPQNMRKRSQRRNLVILRIFRDVEAPSFGWDPYKICMAPDLEKFLGVKNRKFFEIFFMLKNDPKRLPKSPTPHILPKIERFHPFLIPFRDLGQDKYNNRYPSFGAAK